jgi:hypothetical protein
MNTVVLVFLIVMAPNGALTMQKFDNINQCNAVKGWIAGRQLEAELRGRSNTAPTGLVDCLTVTEPKKE